MFTLSIKQSDLDGVHNVRVAFGNGLRVDIWEEFKNRFKIPRIVEFFGATEGTGVFTNVTNTVGAIGRMSPLMVRQWTIKMVSVSQLVELWIMLNKWFNTIFNICVINIDSGAYNSERFPLWICLCTLWFILFFYCRGQLYTEMLIFKSIFLNSTIVLRNQFGTKMDYAFPLNQVFWCCKLWEYKNTIGYATKMI